MIYVSSRVKFAKMWREFRAEGYRINSTWIDRPQPHTSEEWRTLWDACLMESSRCDSLILYAPDTEVLKGALIEVGAAMSRHRPIFYVGIDGPLPLGGLLNNPYFIRLPSVRDALDAATSKGRY